MFKFVKKVFFIGLTVLSNFTNVIPLSCISMKNQECKVRPEIIMLIVMNLYFIILVLKQVNVVVVVTILMIHMQKCVPDVIKDLNVKEFNLISRNNET